MFCSKNALCHLLLRIMLIAGISNIRYHKTRINATSCQQQRNDNPRQYPF